jgi:pimeloyl-ACP methyl ester carboxylesterase
MRHSHLALLVAASITTACTSASHGQYTAGWRHGGAVATIELSNGFTLRYLVVGEGPPMVLLHTVRTQLDYFEKLVPALRGHHRVYVIDLPGHGQSTILDTEYTEPLFRQSVAELITRLDLRDLTLVGESMGGVLALTVAAKLPDRIARVVAINPYDYGTRFGGGIRNGNAGWIIGVFNTFPMETRWLLAQVIESGFKDRSRLGDRMLDELFATGKRAGYRRMEYSLFANWHSWVEARALYPLVKAPVTLVYSSNDWSTAEDRRRTRLALGVVTTVTLPDTGHFASLEHPDAVLRAILAADGPSGSSGLRQSQR